MAGAALHPRPDDPGHVHPHLTFTGQLSQHQAVHIALKEETRFVPTWSYGSNLRLSLSSFCAASLDYTKTLFELDKATEQETDCISLLNLWRDATGTFWRNKCGLKEDVADVLI